MEDSEVNISLINSVHDKNAVLDQNVHFSDLLIDNLIKNSFFGAGQ